MAADRSARSAVIAALRTAGCVFAEDEADLLLAATADPGQLAALVDRRAGGEPLEYVLGWAEFLGHRIAVEPGVFVPRHRTEFLVGLAVGLSPAGPVLVDLCCGSGALGVAFAAAVPVGQWYAADLDPAAVRCARRNVGPAAQVFAGDLFAALPGSLRGGIDILLANTPYVPTGEIRLLPPEARDHEHRIALDGGPDGLALARRVLAEAPGWLAPGGNVLIETSQQQAQHLVEVAARHGLSARSVVDRDEDGEANATVVIATSPGPGVGE